MKACTLTDCNGWTPVISIPSTLQSIAECKYYLSLVHAWSHIQVVCLSIADKCLYVGTGCGLIVYYQLENNKTPLGKIVFQSKVRGRIQLGGEKVNYDLSQVCAFLLIDVEVTIYSIPLVYGDLLS